MALTADQVPGITAKVLAMREREQYRLKRISDYMRGYHDSVYVPDGARSEYRWLLQRSVVNFLPLVVSVIAENLHVDGYLPTDPEGEVTAPASAGSAAVKTDPANPWSIWHANRMQARQHGLHRAVAKYGISYTVVLPGSMQGPGGEVTATPVIRAVSPRKLTALYADDVDDEWPVYAVEERLLQTGQPGQGGNQGNGVIRVVRLYDDTNRYTMVGREGQTGLYWPGDGPFDDTLLGGWQGITAGDLPAVEEHGLGVCPVVRFLHDVDLDGEMDVSGVAEPLIPLQDQINTTTFNTLMAQQYGAFRQRWVTGMVPDDESGRPREPFRAGVDRLFVAEDADTKFGEFSQTALGDFLNAREASIRHMSTISQVPPYHLLGAVANLPLALDTPVPTPQGRKMMGELKQGDEVFAPSGSTVKVKALSPVFHDHECYRLRFDDGTEVVADAQHRWTTTHFVNPSNPYGHVTYSVCPECGWESPAGAARGVQGHRAQKHGIKREKRPSGGVRETSIVTTAGIAASLQTRMGTFNHYIPVAKPWDGPEQDFIIDPYVLGVFLGDGDHTHGTITSHCDDAEEMAANLRACGEIADVMPYADGSDRRKICIRHDWNRCPFGHERPRGTHDDTARCRECRRNRDLVSPRDLPRVNASFQWRMRALDLYKNKHIPEAYFQGSFKQRLALLQGIMDTDGSVNRGQGSLAITLHHERLAGDLHRLICSLGHKAVLRERGWKSSQLGTSGTCWRISWSSPDPAFRLGRKLALQRMDFGDGDGKSNSPFRRYIIACDPVDPVPVRCITVDSEDHQFCVTDALVPTCNSAEALAAARDGLDRAINELQSVLAEPYKQTLRLAGLAAGNQAAWEDRTSTVVWRDTSARAFAATADALGKVAQMLGVPATELWSRIPGVSAEEVARWKQVAESQGALAELNRMIEASFTQNANPNGPPTDNEPFQGPASGRQKGI